MLCLEIFRNFPDSAKINTQMILCCRLHTSYTRTHKKTNMYEGINFVTIKYSTYIFIKRQVR